MKKMLSTSSDSPKAPSATSRSWRSAIRSAAVFTSPMRSANRSVRRETAGEPAMASCCAAPVRLRKA